MRNTGKLYDMLWWEKHFVDCNWRVMQFLSKANNWEWYLWINDKWEELDFLFTKIYPAENCKILGEIWEWIIFLFGSTASWVVNYLMQFIPPPFLGSDQQLLLEENLFPTQSLWDFSNPFQTPSLMNFHLFTSNSIAIFSREYFPWDIKKCRNYHHTFLCPIFENDFCDTFLLNTHLLFIYSYQDKEVERKICQHSILIFFRKAESRM